jgi:hypothetical protein
VQVFVALEPVDLRYSFGRLSALAKEQIGYDARSVALFVFFGRRRDALRTALEIVQESPARRRAHVAQAVGRVDTEPAPWDQRHRTVSFPQGDRPPGPFR